MSGLAPSVAPLTARQMRLRMLAQRIDDGVLVQPNGPAVPPITPLVSSFGGFPNGQTAIPSNTPAATFARYSLGV